MYFADNNNIVTNRDEPEYNRLAKIQPLLDLLRDQCLRMFPGQDKNVDEQIIKFKGKKSLKSYIPKKPTKCGFEVYSRNAPDGYMHDFFIYK